MNNKRGKHIPTISHMIETRFWAKRVFGTIPGMISCVGLSLSYRNVDATAIHECPMCHLTLDEFCGEYIDICKYTRPHQKKTDAST